MRFAGSKTGVDFSPIQLSAGRSGGNYSAAAGAVDLGNSFTSMRSKAPKYGELSSMAMQTQSLEKQAAMKAEGDVTSQGMAAYSAGKQSQMQAQAAIESAKIEAEASKQSAMMSAVGSIASAGLGLFGSDERIKTAITPIESALGKLRELKPVTFYYKSEYGDHTRKHHGFVAQEYETVLPDATYRDEDGIMSIDPIDVIGLLVRGNQELETRIARLEAKLALQAV